MEQAVAHNQSMEVPVITRELGILGGVPIVAAQRIPLRFAISFGDTPEGYRKARQNYPTRTIAQIEAAFIEMRETKVYLDPPRGTPVMRDGGRHNCIATPHETDPRSARCRPHEVTESGQCVLPPPYSSHTAVTSRQRPLH